MAEKKSSDFHKSNDSAAGFLSSGGEMGENIRNFHWENTSFGPIHCWPQSLKTSLSIIVRSKFPMVLMWGEEYIFFYNDAYRPTLGNDGKHPKVLGKPASTIWEEAWHSVEPLLDKVYNEGESVLLEDLLIPIYRNGRYENVYWTFSYSPVTDESGSTAGVFITCLETTEKILRLESFEENSRSLNMAMEIAELGIFKIDLINDRAIYSHQIIELLGLNHHNVPLSEMLEKIHPEDKSVVLEVIKNSISAEGEGKHDMIYRVINPFNNEVKYLRSIGQVLFSDGKAVSISGIIQDVSQQILSKKILEDREKEFRNLVKQAPVAIAVFRGNDLTADIVNDAYLQLVGKGREEFVGKPLSESIPKTREILEPVAREMLRSGKAYHLNELELKLHRNGREEVCWFKSVWEPYYESGGKMDGFTQVVNEITDQVLAKDRFQAAVQAIEGVLWTNNARGEMEGEQPGWAFMTGQRYEEYQGYGWAKAVHPDDAQATIDAWQKAFHERRTFVFEHRLLLKNGTWGHFSIRAIPVFNSDGSIREWVGVHTDITDQKLAELTLKESEARFRSLADQSPMFVYIVEPDARATMSYFNKTWLDYTGQNFDEAIGKAWKGVIHPDDVKQVVDIYVPAFDSQESYTIPAVRVRRYDGEYRWHIFKGNPRHLTNGEFIGFVGVGIDIHEQKLALEQLELNNAQLIRINNDLDNFIYTASHDLRAPMSNIEGLLNALRSSYKTDSYVLSEETETLLALMEQSVNRFKTTILDLTEISKVQREQNEDVIEIKVDEIIEDVKLSIQETIKVTNARIETNVSEVNTINFSRKNIKSIIYNLLSNAIKYRDDKRIPKILIKTEDTEKYTILIVKDNGLGIQEENLDKVFSMFKRFHDHVEGTGIGLYIVKRIIENAGGRIEVESEQGKGTTFRTYFPKREVFLQK